MADDHLTDTAFEIFCVLLTGENPLTVHDAQTGEQRARTAFVLAHAFHKVAAEQSQPSVKGQQARNSTRYLSSRPRPLGEPA